MLQSLLYALPELIQTAGILFRSGSAASSMIGGAEAGAAAAGSGMAAISEQTVSQRAAQMYWEQLQAQYQNSADVLSAQAELRGGVSKPSILSEEFKPNPSSLSSERIQRQNFLRRQQQAAHEYWTDLGREAGHNQPVSPVSGHAKLRQLAAAHSALQATYGGAQAAAGGGGGGGGGSVPASPIPAPGGGGGGGGSFMGSFTSQVTRSSGALALMEGGILAIATLLKTFAERVGEGNRELAKWDGSLAASFAKLDIHRMGLERDTAAETSGSAAMLNESLAELADAIQPIKNDLINALNFLAIIAAQTAKGAVYLERAMPLMTLVETVVSVLKDMLNLQKQQGRDPIADFINAGKNLGGFGPRAPLDVPRPRPPIPPVRP